MQNQKSTTTAGLLGVTLGAFGVHNFYLGDKKRKLGFVHLLLAIISSLALITAAVIEMVTRYAALPNSIMSLLYVIGYLIAAANIIWGSVEGFILLAKPDDAPLFPATKTPLSPAAKKNILRGSLAAGGTLLVLIIASVVLTLVFNVNYGESYRAAQPVKEYIAALYSDSNCERVIDYVDSAWTSEKTYNGYVEACKELVSNKGNIITTLGNTSAVKKDEEIAASFKKFQDAYNKAFPDTSELSDKLDLYQAWHTFISRYDDISVSRSSEKDYQDAAAVLINSGNEELAAFGEEWLTLALDYRSAYKAYWDNSSAGNNEYKTLTDARSALNNYMDDNAPDMDDVAELDFSGVSKLYNEFRTLYSLISDGYAKHYDNSGDCSTSAAGTIRCM